MRWCPDLPWFECLRTFCGLLCRFRSQSKSPKNPQNYQRLDQLFGHYSTCLQCSDSPASILFLDFSSRFFWNRLILAYLVRSLFSINHFGFDHLPWHDSFCFLLTFRSGKFELYSWHPIKYWDRASTALRFFSWSLLNSSL